MLIEANPSGSDVPEDIPATRAGPAPRFDWTVIIPFFNERNYLPATLISVAAQEQPTRVILVDNGSTDGGSDIVEAECRRLGLSFTLVVEPRPGKVFALGKGLGLVRTRFVATCDADTWYPADYLTQAGKLLQIEGTAAAGAYYAGKASTPRQRIAAAVHITIMGTLLSRQCHAGGAGQAFRTESLRRAGGFDASRWNWVLEDHEIMHRVAKIGSIKYGLNFWCAPSERDRDRESIRWTLVERILYHLAPFRLQGCYFYEFLGTRLKARHLSSDRIRERRYHDIGVMSDAAPDLVCG